MLKQWLKRFGRKREPTPEELADLEETAAYRELRRDQFVDIRVGPPSGQPHFTEDEHKH